MSTNRLARALELLPLHARQAAMEDVARIVTQYRKDRRAYHLSRRAKDRDFRKLAQAHAAVVKALRLVNSAAASSAVVAGIARQAMKGADTSEVVKELEWSMAGLAGARDFLADALTPPAEDVRHDAPFSRLVRELAKVFGAHVAITYPGYDDGDGKAAENTFLQFVRLCLTTAHSAREMPKDEAIRHRIRWAIDTGEIAAGTITQNSGRPHLFTPTQTAATEAVTKRKREVTKHEQAADRPRRHT